MKKILLALFFWFLAYPAFAQVGVLVRPDTTSTSFPSPVAGSTFAFLTSNGTIEWYNNSSSWVTISSSPGGTSGQIQYNNSGLFQGFTVSGDATLNTSTGALTLATVNSNVGSFINANITVNAKGLITAASSGGVKYSLSAQSTAFTANATSGTFYVITASSAVPVTLPPTPADGTTYKFVVISGSALATLTANGSDTITNGAQSGSTLTLGVNQGVVVLTAISGGWLVS
jgi:hypothetical protein